MPNTSSAKKALRVDIRKNAINAGIKESYRSARKAVTDAITEGKVANAKKALPAAYSKIDMAAKKGLLHKGTAARYKSRLAQAVKKADSK